MSRSVTYLCLFLSFSVPQTGHGQAEPPDSGRVYRIKAWISTGIGVAGAGAIYFGRQRNNGKHPLSEAELQSLDPHNVLPFDRIALRQDISRRQSWETVSDAGLFTAAALPALLLIDRGIRRDWLQIGALYFETQSLNVLLHTYGPGPFWIDRIRPSAYYEELPPEERTDPELRNSFYSAHGTITATASFFMAKVLADYHPEWGAKRLIGYGIALVPTTLMAVSRTKALKHFPTDTIVGSLLGAATGILIPELHRFKDGRMKFSMIYREQLKGAAFRMTF